MVFSQQNSSQEIKKRGRKPKKVPLVDGKEPRKANFIKKIIDGHKQTQAKSFDKRRPTLMKKARELQTLCDVDVCVVCFSPDGKVDVWPEDQTRVKDLIFKYKALDKNKKKESDYLDFLESKKVKLQNKKEKMMKLKIDGLISGLSKKLDSLSGDSLMDAVNELEAKIKNFKLKIELLRTEEEKAKAVQADKQIIISTQSSVLNSTSEIIHQEFDHNWPWKNYMNSDTNTPVDHGSCSSFPDIDSLIEENFELLSGVFCSEDPVNHFQAADNDFPLQENADKPQENFGMVMGENHGFLSEALPISVWAPQLSHFQSWKQV